MKGREKESEWESKWEKGMSQRVLGTDDEREGRGRMDDLRTDQVCVCDQSGKKNSLGNLPTGPAAAYKARASEFGNGFWKRFCYPTHPRRYSRLTSSLLSDPIAANSDARTQPPVGASNVGRSITLLE